MTTDQLSKFRFALFLITGLVTASYGVLALLWNTPQPFWMWLPAICGIAAWAMIWIYAIRAGKKIQHATFDELFLLEWSQAVRFAYWFAIALYPVFGLFLVFGNLADGVAFASMGTLTGAAPLLAFCVISLRG